MKWDDIRRTPIGRRAAFAAVNILILAAIYLIAVEPARRMVAESADTIAQRRLTLARYEAVAAQEEAIHEYARQVDEINARGELIAGDSEGIVNANLQARLKALAEEAKVSVRSIQVLPARSFQGVTLVGARIDVAGTHDSVHALARAVEGEPPLLIVTTATLRGQSMMWGSPGEAPDELEAQFDVYGGAPSLKAHP
ncbi:type II secretion system protein M [Methylocystis sp. WRRC1]|uniref:type II secretion system protein GspM n=1 Tax=Methylocystis sp. WRRC1 TaxID=1732014 RepID=UPI001D136844|nr:type II secretion system protein GspM [Methylocystis sp. WRRC1]MCC3245803.1 type II secretion system protein M [Methylocystis sp. WRRC1]